MPELWVPGAEGPSMEDFVQRLHKSVERFATEKAGGQATVEIELADGSLLTLVSILPEPGYGFVTLCPHCEEHEPPEEVIVPVGAICELRLLVPKNRPHFRFGFSPPEEEAPAL
jgi:hypothetical protein